MNIATVVGFNLGSLVSKCSDSLCVAEHMLHVSSQDLHLVFTTRQLDV
jgi:hypothetical protein